MRNLTNLAAVAAALLLAGTALAKDETGGQAKEKKICKIEVMSNSRIPERRVCRTQAEWAAQGDEDAQKAQNAVRSAGRGN
jgi:hypothetical protein